MSDDPIVEFLSNLVDIGLISLEHMDDFYAKYVEIKFSQMSNTPFDMELESGINISLNFYERDDGTMVEILTCGCPDMGYIRKEFCGQCFATITLGSGCRCKSED